MKRSITVLIVTILIYYCQFLIPKIFYYLSFLFINTEGQFDFSIFWTAILGVATLTISGVSLWQTNLFRKKDTILNNKVLLLKKSGVYKGYSSTYKKELIHKNYKPSNVFILKNAMFMKNCTEDRSYLHLKFNFITANELRPEMFLVKNIQIKETIWGDDVLLNDIVYINNPAIINELTENGFNCEVEVFDNNLEKIIKEEFIIFVEFTFIIKVDSYSVETDYFYIGKIDLKHFDENEVENHYTSAVEPQYWEDLLMVNKGTRLIKSNYD